MSAEAAQRCGECGVEVRLVHRYPKGQQPERSHPAVATARGEPPGTAWLIERGQPEGQRDAADRLGEALG